MERKIRVLVFLLAVAGLLLAGSAFAQTSGSAPPANPSAQAPTNTSGAGPGVTDPGHPRVNQLNRRQERQQQRIANGIKSGQLKPAQVETLEKHEKRIEAQEKHDMAAHNGHLTKGEQRKINKELNQNSRDIHKDRTQK